MAPYLQYIIDYILIYFVYAESHFKSLLRPKVIKTSSLGKHWLNLSWTQRCKTSRHRVSEKEKDREAHYARAGKNNVQIDADTHLLIYRKISGQRLKKGDNGYQFCSVFVFRI